ncbi:MAG: outer membrane protein assembly factor BamA [Elusimicrobiaceae bacterium]|uniref:outer membrane protein assembly factor BamA n=1 Tax=Candidatus Avelusimicrobium faecicola TaxID=3416205 RepID=UPI002A7E8860|nr:outer membrane protein assembly factor BamA [Spirochaetota bacterium]MDY2939528.1 outer membrane protein assembly factor BamA [Elusimicrobiaceae bacterium]
MIKFSNLQLFGAVLLLAQPVFAAQAIEEEVDPNGPWMVCEVAVEGLRNISKRTVTKAGSAKKGALYERYSVSEDINDISALGNFDKVEVDISRIKGTKKDKQFFQPYPCHRLTYIVTEKPIFDRLTYQGRKHLGKGAITQAMTLKLKDPFNQAKLDADLARIQAKYAEKGYVNAQIKYELTRVEKENTVEVKLIIDEGPRTRVEAVNITGLHEIPLKKLLAKASNKPGKVYKPQNLQRDYVKMMLYGRNQGYAQFMMTEPKLDYNADKSLVSVSYDVTEGPKVDFGTTAFEGSTVFSDAELKEKVYYRTGKLYNQKDFEDTVSAIQEAYADKGYLQARVQPRYDVQNGLLNISFDISEGGIFYIDNVDVSGYGKTKKYVFTRELSIHPGDLYDAAKIRRSQTKIMNLGFINDVQVDLQPTADPQKVDLGFNVVEGRPGMFQAGLAMSSMDGLYGEVSVNHLNFLNRAQRLSLRTMFGKEILDYTVSWYTPWIYEKPTSLGVDAFNTRRYRSFVTENQAYTEKRIGGRVKVGPRFNDDIYQLSFGYSFENVDIYDIDPKYMYAPGKKPGEYIEKGKTNISTFSADAAIDTRDNMWDPTRGWRNSLGVALAGGPIGGDLDLWYFNARSIFNHTVLNVGGNYPIVFVLSNKFGSVQPYGRTKYVPPYEKFFLGGADTVRGYERAGEIGPVYGGDMYYVMNAELRFPIAREGRRNMAQFAFFFDMGNSWDHFDDIDFSLGPNEHQFKAGVGVGLRFTTPALPIRIDWGYGLNHAKGQDKSHFYFNMSNMM